MFYRAFTWEPLLSKMFIFSGSQWWWCQRSQTQRYWKAESVMYREDEKLFKKRRKKNTHRGGVVFSTGGTSNHSRIFNAYDDTHTHKRRFCFFTTTTITQRKYLPLSLLLPFQFVRGFFLSQMIAINSLQRLLDGRLTTFYIVDTLLTPAACSQLQMKDSW